MELRRGDVRELLLGALAELDRRLPLAVPVLIGGDRGAETGLDSTDPGRPDREVAVAGQAGAAEAEAAVAAAQEGFAAWRRRSGAERAAALTRAAATLRERRPELAALQVRECAKPWPEADADVCEAIDFLEYYALGAAGLDHPPELAQVQGERNTMRYEPLGVAAVIAPWNFPLAIPAGMTAAALAAGNAVVLKPAEQSPGCALALVEALHGAGVPPAALSLLPGEGDVGAALVSDPRVNLIAFTGSGAVGLEIVRAAAQTPAGQAHVKRVIAEMGGKNCVIVDADADLDDAVPAIVDSAFGYAGQKCSAASRVLVHEAIAEHLLERLVGATDALIVGQADSFATDVPPLIEATARERVIAYREQAASGGQIATGARELPGAGWFAEPTIASGLPADAPALREEIFGPFLCVEAVASTDEALAIVDSLPYALTAGLFSRDPKAVAAVADAIPAGNLYVNRSTTGAMVARQPFGGHRLSGIGFPSGGPDYLRQFTRSRAVSENTMRHGLETDA
ncbi:MAG: RHH-type transcriptional regulator, proline utilization regulon repressor / proline dehydrogenase [Solirubrobacterales bacterium]|jgi:RHH-type proline utilization regulon transcriptional repressor/proline dehydrogenase/delta 1-pyrroline-5-carboxylate dehydrogenase|nr:RHH-type transcriptional regulator, proline utilization regulon repressor / proline dehydrogenase [Solirubrobacterales bacterium]